MFIIIILIVLAGVVYLIMNSSAQNTTTPNTNISYIPQTTTTFIPQTTTTFIPQTTTPFINTIPNFLLYKGNLDIFYTANKMIDNADSQSRITSNLTWNGDMNSIINSVDNDENRLAAQFRYFAEFWLNKLNINSGFTNVYDTSGNIGIYDFARNNTIYFGKFNDVEWNWDTADYCFTIDNSKKEEQCMGGWTFNKDNGKCYPPLNSTSTCDNYNHSEIYEYTNQNDINNWMTSCNVFNSPNCKMQEVQLENQQQFVNQQPPSSSSQPISSTQPPSSSSQPISSTQPPSSKISTGGQSNFDAPADSKAFIDSQQQSLSRVTVLSKQSPSAQSLPSSTRPPASTQPPGSSTQSQSLPSSSRPPSSSTQSPSAQSPSTRPPASSTPSLSAPSPSSTQPLDFTAFEPDSKPFPVQKKPPQLKVSIPKIR